MFLFYFTFKRYLHDLRALLSCPFNRYCICGCLAHKKIISLVSCWSWKLLCTDLGFSFWCWLRENWRVVGHWECSTKSAPPLGSHRCAHNVRDQQGSYLAILNESAGHVRTLAPLLSRQRQVSFSWCLLSQTLRIVRGLSRQWVLTVQMNERLNRVSAWRVQTLGLHHGSLTV